MSQLTRTDCRDLDGLKCSKRAHGLGWRVIKLCLCHLVLRNDKSEMNIRWQTAQLTSRRVRHVVKKNGNQIAKLMQQPLQCKANAARRGRKPLVCGQQEVRGWVRGGGGRMVWPATSSSWQRSERETQALTDPCCFSREN